MKIINGEAKNKFKAHELEANVYTNLPAGSELEAGIVKLDGRTLILKEDGSVEVNPDFTGGSGDSTGLHEHILDDAAHLNILRRKLLDKSLPEHLENKESHFNDGEKHNLTVKLSEMSRNIDTLLRHLNLDHLTTEDILDLNNFLVKVNKLLIEHLNNENIHTQGNMNTLINELTTALEELENRLTGLEGKYEEFTKSTEAKMLEKVDKVGWNPNVVLGTDSGGQVIALDIDKGHLDSLRDMIETLGVIFDELEKLLFTVNTHILNEEIHFTRAGVIDDVLRMIEAAVGAIECKLTLTSKPLVGHVPFFAEENTDVLRPAYMCNTGRFVTNQSELEAAKVSAPSFEEVFKRWKRFSHDASGRIPAIPAELESWGYDSVSDSVICTQNTNSYVGFISRERFDSYSHTCTLSSNENDDDMIGIVVAYTIFHDEECTLSAVRIRNTNSSHTEINGAKPTWALVYNYKKSDARIIQAVDIPGDQTGAWSGTSGSTIRVIRAGDNIELKASIFGSTVLAEESRIFVNLDSDPDLHKFKTHCAYGYSCYSQSGSTFSGINFSSGNDAIYDLSTNIKWERTQSGWVQSDGGTLAEDVGHGAFLYNPSTSKLMFSKNSDDFIVIDLEPGIRTENQICTSPKDGDSYFDKKLNKALWFINNKWVDALGKEV